MLSEVYVRTKVYSQKRSVVSFHTVRPKGDMKRYLKTRQAQHIFQWQLGMCSVNDKATLSSGAGGNLGFHPPIISLFCTSPVG